MKLARLAATCLLTSVLAVQPGCDSDDGADVPANQLRYHLEVQLQPGAEVHRCQFVTTRDVETFVIGGAHSYSPGSHHMLLFRTDLTAIPPELAGVRDCYEGASSIMSHIRGLVYGAQQPQGDSDYPAGVGLPLAANEVLLMQAHSINATGAVMKATVDLTLKTGAAADVQQRAGSLFFYDPFISVPAGAAGRATMSCNIPSPIRLLTANSHMHKRGVGYRAFLDTPAARATTPFYTTDSWDHPSQLAAPMDLAANSVIRFECDYQNTSATPYFQGQSADSNEMCMFVGVYYPALTQADEFCTVGPHDFGTGTATCAQTLSCIQQCPPGTAPMVGVGGTGGTTMANVHECWQKCFADSCPAAWKPFSAQTRCVRASCATECATPGSTECQSCALDRCGAELNACFTSTCS